MSTMSTSASTVRGTVGRRRSPIWEHFKAAENVHGKRVAQCLFCERKMKSQPDRMENHFIKLCPSVDDETRGQWLLARANNAAAAPALEQTRVYDAAAALALEQKRESDSTANTVNVVNAPTSAVVDPDPVAVGAVVTTLDSDLRRQRQSEPPSVASSEPVDVDESNVFIATTVAPSPVAIKTRKSPPSKSTSAAKRPKLATAAVESPHEQQSRVSANATTAHVAPASCSCSADVQRHRLEFEERKDALELEGMRYDNDMKRIKLAEENMLARKRLQDAGVPYADIELLLPLQR